LPDQWRVISLGLAFKGQYDTRVRGDTQANKVVIERLGMVTQAFGDGIPSRGIRESL
jgi:hypothetical protein